MLKLGLPLPFVLVLYATILFQCCSSNAYHQQPLDKNNTKVGLTMFPDQLLSTVTLSVTGSLQQGIYSLELNIGNPPKPYTLDIDTGSELTWLQCDAPCHGSHPSPHGLYRPPSNGAVLCNDPLCGLVQQPLQYPCAQPNDICHYEVGYQDRSSSIGFLVRDSLHFPFGARVATPNQFLKFGCGFDQRAASTLHTDTDGVLGLSRSSLSVAAQLRYQHLTQNVFGHCFGRSQGGFFFFGRPQSFLSSPGINWSPMAEQHRELYSPGHADIIFDGMVTDIRNLDLVFDTGSTYSYFPNLPYEATLDIVNKSLRGTPLTHILDSFLDSSYCWSKSLGVSRIPIRSFDEVRTYFKTLELVFLRSGKRFQMSPEDYLVISPDGNVCFGILDGGKEGLVNFALIGNISFQNKLVIYDNEKNQIGWIGRNCITPRVGDEYSTDVVGNLSSMDVETSPPPVA